MAHATNNNPSPTDADASLSETKFYKMVENIIDIEVLEELKLSERSIYKVPCNLRSVNKEAYTPQCISIGPIHLNKEELKPMQEHKLRYFHFFWERVSNEKAMEIYKQYLKTEEEQIRLCYAEKFHDIPKATFVDMMLLDAVFIMELLLRNSEWKSNKSNHEYQYQHTRSVRANLSEDLILTQSWLIRNITRDLILIENQIPLFLLQKLYDDVVVPFGENEKEATFVDLAIKYFAFYDTLMPSDETKKRYICGLLQCPKQQYMSRIKDKREEIKKHFTDFIYPVSNGSQKLWESKSEDNGSKKACNQNSKDSRSENPKGPKHFTDLIRCFYLPTKCNSGRADNVLRTATKLQDSGVSFEKCDVDKPLLEITFDKIPILSLFLCFGCFSFWNPFKASLRIPQLKVDHTTECVFRNLIAFEQCHYPDKPYICNYVSLIDSLIHTQLDVELLVEKEVIVHELGSHKEVASLVNGLCKHVVANSTCYYKIINELDKHYMNDWNYTVAALRLVYFRDLWRASSTVVGIAVIIFAVFQFLRVVRCLF